MYEVVPYSDQRCISVKWICSAKETINDPQEKARLVARGIGEDTLNSFKKQSPTTSKDSLHVILLISLFNKFAFLSSFFHFNYCCMSELCMNFCYL